MIRSGSRAPTSVVAAILILVSACSSDAVTRAGSADPARSEVAVHGTLSIGVVKGNRMEFVTREEPWATTAESRDGVLSVTRGALDAGVGAAKLSASPAVLADDAEFGANAAPVVLEIRADHPLARGRPNEAYANRFTANGHEYTVATLFGATGGPAARIIFFEDGKAVHTAHYDWVRSGNSWKLREVWLSTWSDGRPTGVVISKMRNDVAVSAAPSPSTGAIVADASNAILDAMAFVADRFLLPTKANAQTKKLYFSECSSQWFAVSGFGLQLAFALHPASGLIEKAKVAMYAHALLGSYAALAKCVSDQRKLDGQTQQTQRVAGDITTINDEPLSWGDLPADVQKALRDLAAYCQQDNFDIVCAQVTFAY